MSSPRRSDAWFAGSGRSRLIHRAALVEQGIGAADLDGRPVIGIAHSASELNPCNRHLGRLADAVRNGVLAAGGVPLVFPTMSLGEPLMRPTTMLYRNLMAMEVEELIRANPLDGVVLLSGCDKTTPAMLMAAASLDLPAVMVTGGPKLNGKWQGRDVGSGTLVWELEQEMLAGRMTQEECEFAQTCSVRSEGHCMTMGTASTMACMAEALGMQLPGSAALPAVDTRRYAIARMAGREIVTMVASDLTPSKLLTRKAFENAIRVNAALGGSTNAILHLLAIAGRIGVDLPLEDFDSLARDVPTLLDLMPSGRFLMEDFCYAGGLPALMREMGDLLHGDALTPTGATLDATLAGAQVFGQEVIRPLHDPLAPAGTGTAVLYGNLAPHGAVIKQSAASLHLLSHTGRALVFESPEEYHEAAADPDLPVDESTVIVLRNNGPVGYPGMPEVANVPVPAKLLKQGITDIVRISDGRMSGTAYGTVVVHIAPEAAVGGPLALVRTGDTILLDVPQRTLTLDVDDAELARRKAAWPGFTPPAAASGYAWLHHEHVLQADEGVDLDFLRGARGHAVPRESH